MSDATHPFSFRWVCEQLGLDPACVRQALAALAAAGRGGSWGLAQGMSREPLRQPPIGPHVETPVDG
jgi:hypothetical protein